jgi:hypothetical protein
VANEAQISTPPVVDFNKISETTLHAHSFPLRALLLAFVYLGQSGCLGQGWLQPVRH